MADWIKAYKKGVLIQIKVVPNSSKNQLSLLDTILKINITAPAVENKANKELVQFLAKLLNVSKSDIQIVSGEKGKQKQIYLSNQDPENIVKLIEEVLS